MLKDLDFADDTPQLSLTMIQIRNMEAHQDREKEDKHLSNQMPQKNSRDQIAATYPKRDIKGDKRSRKRQW